MLTPLDIPSLASGIRDKRRKLIQGTKSMDYYCELYNCYKKDLKKINNRPSQRRISSSSSSIILILHILQYHLFWKHLFDMIPTTLDQVQFKLKQYEAVTVAQQATVMKQHGNSKLPSDGA